MEFSYKIYYRVNFLLPLFVGIFSFLSLSASIVSLSQKIKHRELSKENVISFLAALTISTFLLVLNVGTLARGGIYLCSEKETDAVITHGIVDKIEAYDVYANQKYGSGDGTGVGTSFGVKIWIGDNYYYAMEMGNLKSGDDIIVTYLPRSRFVLKIIKSK